MVEVYLALGSNLGDRVENLKQALYKLESVMTLAAWSPVYETEPQYDTDQPTFLNMAVRGETTLNPRELLARLKGFERELGRKPSRRYGPRAIDIDILFYGDMIIDEPGLAVPHPRMAERDFVLRPLADIAAAKRHPVTGQSVGDMLAALRGGAEIIPFPLDV